MNIADSLNNKMRGKTCVKCFQLDMHPTNLTYNLLLCLSSSEDSEEGDLVVIFEDVSDLYLQGFGGGLTQFMELIIGKEENGFDRKNYRIEEVEENKLRFFCNDIEVIKG